MGTIKPSSQGRTYPIWKMLMNYSLLSMEREFSEDIDPGFRISIINSCWISVESFTKDCLYWHILSNYDEMEVPVEYQYKRGCARHLASMVRSQDVNEIDQLQEKVRLREEFANKAKASSWYPVLKICEQIDRPIDKRISQWEFLKNLYRLRNGLTHGQPIKILKSNVEDLKDEISQEYVKSINYLHGKRIIDMKLLIKGQNISDLLNKTTTDFILTETANCLDAIAQVFIDSHISKQWKEMRK